MGWLQQIVLRYFLTWLGGVTGNIDWNAFVTDATTAVNNTIGKLIPVQWIDAALDKLADTAIVNLAASLQVALTDSADIAQLVADVAAKNFPQALADLEAILAKAVGSGTAAAQHALDVVKVARAA